MKPKIRAYSSDYYQLYLWCKEYNKDYPMGLSHPLEQQNAQLNLMLAYNEMALRTNRSLN